MTKGNFILMYIEMYLRENLFYVLLAEDKTLPLHVCEKQKQLVNCLNFV